MLKRLVVSAMYATCWTIDALSFLPLGRLRNQGCPNGLAFRAARLEDRWGLSGPRTE